MNEIHFCQRKKILNMYDEEIRIFVQSVSITGLNNNPNLFSSWNLNFNIKNLYSIFFLRNGIYFSIAAVYRRWWLGGYLWTEVRFSSGPAPPTPSAEPCWSRNSLRARTPAHLGGSPSFRAYREQNQCTYLLYEPFIAYIYMYLTAIVIRNTSHMLCKSK